MKNILIFILVLLPAMHSAQTMTDTLWSVPWLDGTIAFRPGSGYFNLTTTSASMIAGDGFDFILGEEVFDRSFLGFDLSGLTFPDTGMIEQAIVGIYQVSATGNSQVGVYPIWNVAGGDTHFCVLDHIDYGYSLDLGDWTAGDPGDPQTLQSNIGILSDDTTAEYKILDVTASLKEDIANQQVYNQYRMRFTIDRDFDNLGDQLLFRSGNSIVTWPYLAIQYRPTGIDESQQETPHQFNLHQNFPNPFNATTHIKFSLEKSGFVELVVYGVDGRMIESLVKSRLSPGKYLVSFNREGLSSGVYFYQLTFNHNYTNVKKMLLIR